VDRFEIIILLIMAFLPPIVYAIWIRNTEKYHREKWIPIFLCFLWGATIAVIAALILEVVLHFTLFPSINDYNLIILISAIFIAPFAEEFTKPLALRLKRVKRELDELEDGLIYGAVAGLGFSATENLLYGYSSLQESFLFFIILISIRSIGGCLLHASATAWTGYGYGKVVMKHSKFISILPYFLLAMLIHSLYNGLVAFGIYGVGAGLFAAIGITIATITLVRKKIKTLDSLNP